MQQDATSFRTIPRTKTTVIVTVSKNAAKSVKFREKP
jgi:hypothetical protein